MWNGMLKVQLLSFLFSFTSKMQHNKLHTELPYTRYYLDNFSEKSLAKSAGDRLGIFNTVMKGGKPKIPNLKSKANRDKGQILCTQTTDGSKIL